MGAMELPPGGTVWQPVDDRTTAGDAVRLKAYSERAGVVVRAYGRSGTTVYAGTADGRILISRDDGVSFAATDTGRANGPVEGIFVDPARPEVALAALGGPNAPHVLRTLNAGTFWDALDSTLPNARRVRFMWLRTGAFSGRTWTSTKRAVRTSIGSACRTVCRRGRARPT